MYKTIPAQYFWHWRDVNGLSETVNQYILQIALAFASYKNCTIQQESTLDSSQYCIKNGIKPYLIGDSEAGHYIYIFAHPYGKSDQYVSNSCWLILAAIFDAMPISGQLQDAVGLHRLKISCGAFPYMGTQSGTDAQAQNNDEVIAGGCPMGYFPVITAINKADNSDLPSLTFVGVGRMLTVLAYQPQKLLNRSQLLDKPMGYFSYGRFTKWHMEEDKRCIFVSCLYAMLGCMLSFPCPKYICSIHFINEMVYLSPDATSLRNITWCWAGTDGPGITTMNGTAPEWKEGITFQHMVVPLYRGWCDNRYYWILPSDQNIGSVVGHVSNSPIRKELPVYEVAVVQNDHMTYNNLDEEMKLLQVAKIKRDYAGGSQIIYHPYFMVLRQPEILGEYSTIGECELYGEINGQQYQMGDIFTIKENDGDIHKYQVFKFDHQVADLAFVFEIYAKVKLLRSIDKNNWDLHLYDRWRNYDFLEIEYGSIDGSVKKKVTWTIQDFESQYDSTNQFNVTLDDDYTYVIYSAKWDSLNLSDMWLREASHTGMIYSITGIRE